MMETEFLEVRAGDTTELTKHATKDVTIKQEFKNEAQTDNDNLVHPFDDNKFRATIKLEKNIPVDGNLGENVVKSELVEFHDNYYVTAEISDPNDLETKLFEKIPNNTETEILGYNNFDSNDDDDDSTSDPERDPFAGIDCNSSFSKTADDEEDSKRSQCQECLMSFPKLYLLMKHMKSHRKERVFKCPMPNCEKAFNFNNNLTSHLLQVHFKKLPFACPEPNCGEAFETKYYLQKHEVSHADGTRNKCPHAGCNRKLKNKEDGSTRQATGHPPYKHTPRAKRPLKCGVCQATFCKNWQLTMHLKSHANEILECPEQNCDSTFKCKRNLEVHVAKFHTNPDAFPFQCPEPNCKAKFKFENSVKIHAASLHRKTDSTLFNCTEPNCNKQFRTRRSVNLHVKSHKRPHKCTEPGCSADFARREQLNSHLNTKHNPPPPETNIVM